MTVAGTFPSITFTGDGVTVSFAFPFQVFDSSQVQAVWVNGAGTEITLIEGSDYDVVLSNGESSSFDTQPLTGTLTTKGARSPIPAGHTLQITRVTEFDQEMVYPRTGVFPAKSHEYALDRLTMMVQEIERSLQIGVDAGAVTSVFGRIGAVTSAINDYTASQVGNDSSVTGAQVSDALNSLNSAISALNSSVSTNTTNIGNNTTAINGLDGRVTTIEGAGYVRPDQPTTITAQWTFPDDLDNIPIMPNIGSTEDLLLICAQRLGLFAPNASIAIQAADIQPNSVLGLGPLGPQGEGDMIFLPAPPSHEQTATDNTDQIMLQINANLGVDILMTQEITEGGVVALSGYVSNKATGRTKNFIAAVTIPGIGTLELGRIGVGPGEDLPFIFSSAIAGVIGNATTVTFEGRYEDVDGGVDGDLVVEGLTQGVTTSYVQQRGVTLGISGGQNLGGSAGRQGVFKQVNGAIMEYHSIVGTGGITVTLTNDEIVLDGGATGGTGTVTGGQNQGGGAYNIYQSTNGPTMFFNTIAAGTGISITQSNNLLTLSASNAVDSVFGRTGAVDAVAGDYTAAEVTFDPGNSNLSSIETQAAIDELDAIAAAKADPGSVVAKAGDTMTGNLTLPTNANPNSLHAITRAFADAAYVIPAGNYTWSGTNNFDEADNGLQRGGREVPTISSEHVTLPVHDLRLAVVSAHPGGAADDNTIYFVV